MATDCSPALRPSLAQQFCGPFIRAGLCAATNDNTPAATGAVCCAHTPSRAALLVGTGMSARARVRHRARRAAAAAGGGFPQQYNTARREAATNGAAARALVLLSLCLVVLVAAGSGECVLASSTGRHALAIARLLGAHTKKVFQRLHRGMPGVRRHQQPLRARHAALPVRAAWRSLALRSCDRLLVYGLLCCVGFFACECECWW